MDSHIVVALVVTLGCGVAHAQTRASLYLNFYGASLHTGSEQGEIEVSYYVQAKTVSDYVGVSKIEVYTTGGVKVQTIWGSVSNGLLRASAGAHDGDFPIDCTPGESYYAKVTVFAEKDGGSDSKTVTTNIAAAHS